MSRSYRKNPYVTDQQHMRGGAKKAKQQANSTIRSSDITPQNGKAYRKYSCSWSIRDYSFYAPDYKKGKRK